MCGNEFEGSFKHETKILIIDDEEVIHKSIRKILSRKGFSMESAFSVKEALQKLRETSYDLVITDLMMPDKNGIELIETLQEEGSKLPIVMITGYPTINTAMKAMRLGALDYIAKPFTHKELLGPVLRALQQPSDDSSRNVDGKENSFSVDSLMPGTVFFLPRHSWACFNQDGTFDIGIEESFLECVGKISAISCSDEEEIVEQGAFAVILINEKGEEHRVAIPLTGQIHSVNKEVLLSPDKIDQTTWLLKVLPSHLESELSNLLVRS